MTGWKRSLCLAVVLAASARGEWAMKKGPLMTKWAADVKAEAPLPEYPRPQMTRAAWQNLNGVWEYQPGKDGDAAPFGKTLSSQILVPFPVESAISGVMEQHDRLWYRRSFTVPAAWSGKRVLLHFGAVDHEAEVFVNGKSLTTHQGGYDPFTVDVTDSLNGTGPQELIVRVFDPTNNAGYPRGKQSLYPEGIMYTPCTGIWQTVWMEPVAAGGVASLKITPDIDKGEVRVSVNALGNADGSTVTLTAKDGSNTVGTASGKPGDELTIKVPSAKLWSPDSPFLYDLAVRVEKNGQAVDEVASYFGMRKSSLGEENGVKRLLLNNKFVFQFGPLDQGFWPDGIYTAPTDEALKYDIQVTKDMGFNMIRKHIKVEPLRWYYHCDKIGLLVWQDMPSANSYPRRGEKLPPVDKAAFKSELIAMINHLYNVPCIVQWEPYNEGQGQHDTAEIVALIKKLDPTRTVNQASGGHHDGVGDVYDIHPYPAPQMPKTKDPMALAVGEFGGITLLTPGHMWDKDGHGYVSVQNPDELVDLYAEFTAMLQQFKKDGLSAAVYTQTTDVEKEVNGLLTYDRIPKADVAKIARATRMEVPLPVYATVTPTSENESQTWKYTTTKPQGEVWRNADFDDKQWKEGKGGFGSPNTPGIGELGTEWRTPDIWLRRTIDLSQMKPADLEHVMLRLYHDEDVQVFLNGVPAYRHGGFNGRYQNLKLTDEARKALKAGPNVLAVHCRQTIGGQYIDVGLVKREPSPAQ